VARQAKPAGVHTPGGVLHKKPHNGVRIDCRVGLCCGFTPARPAWPGKSAHAAQVAQEDRRPRTLPVSSGNASLHGQTLSMAARTVPIASARVSRALASSGLWGLAQRASDERGHSPSGMALPGASAQDPGEHCTDRKLADTRIGAQTLSRIMAGKTPCPFRQPAGSASASC